MIVITCSWRDLETTDPDDLMEAWEFVQEEVARYGIKFEPYQFEHIIIEVEEL